MNKKIIASSVLTALMVLPSLALAFTPGNIPSSTSSLNINGLIDVVLNILWPIAVAFFIVMFVLAGFLFATAQGEPDKLGQARSAVIYGLVGVVVAVLAFSVVTIVRQQVSI